MPAPWTQSEQQAVRDFPRAAESFCELIDRLGECNRGQLFDKVAVQLAHVCSIAAQLPVVEPDTEGEDYSEEEVASHSEEYQKLTTSLRKKINDLDVYWTVFDPTRREEPDSGSLSGDLAEVYLDLKDALELHRRGGATNDLYWDWRFDFRSHWSRHATEALKVILFNLDAG
jgi:hypothetical protein